ncbi:bifunctional 3-phenylpropionate/cinnamic acid dioxygenase ferredoxin subunit [Geodermatophilus obscurus]|uniref:Rieske (2Fe-2S) iron-sulphur domain protein n=1 Tax=Geodermatophilus obscurus (strain ATCC 25078 / DSM 43160 / JCM 3152 / CCUG 61914 / KCC A-0152 / KCTC 9177 / NBRC 13315 / NRRL B-3577 / G-20) TaxID=526225 RepID=D2S7S2_GEOOG|nr:bifunctional 3-phenylpropionate/cinnamic acid dioxygenase ferredoxin subunit [Geodermatophilus obscurus]ADB75531.1 Rieske (2Fe-2S) iron-sulphur domain protein [Geodermatophilus obscurus DSM 43160]
MLPVCPTTALPPGEATRVEADEPIAVFNVDVAVYTIDDTCTHQDASLADGWLDGCAVECPLHASCFDLRTGKVSGPPAKTPVRTTGSSGGTAWSTCSPRPPRTVPHEPDDRRGRGLPGRPPAVGLDHFDRTVLLHDGTEVRAGRRPPPVARGRTDAVVTADRA